MARAINSQIEDCNGFSCGNLLNKGSIPANRLEPDSMRELIREVIEEFSSQEWFRDIFRELIREFSKEEWFNEIVREFFEKPINEQWFKDLIKEVLLSYINEQWFKDLICGLGCGGAQPIFTVSPNELVFDAEGGTKSFVVQTNSTTSWSVNC